MSVLKFNEWQDLNGDKVYTAAEMNAIGTWEDFPSGTGFVNITVGNGLLSQRYTVINNVVLFVASFQLGSTSALTGGAFNVPVEMTSSNDGLSFSASMTDGSLGVPAMVRYNGTTQVLIRAVNAAGTYAVAANLSATVPFTWADTDRIAIQGIYEKA